MIAFSPDFGFWSSHQYSYIAILVMYKIDRLEKIGFFASVLSFLMLVDFPKTMFLCVIIWL